MLVHLPQQVAHVLMIKVDSGKTPFAIHVDDPHLPL
jgi:hypothetical protein